MAAAQRGDVRLHRRLGIVLGHRHAPAAAGAELAQREAVPVAHLGRERDEHGRGIGQRLRLVDLRADVAVQPDQLQPRRLHRQADRSFGVTRGDGEAELGVQVAGLDVGVGVRRYAGGEAEPDGDWT